MSERVDKALWITEQLKETSDDHEARIRVLESLAAKVLGMATLGAILGSILAKIFTSVIYK